MSRLVVNPGTPNAWEIELKPGVNSLGRSEENDFSIEHPSVSSSHCEIVVTESGARIKDPGSINGTFVDGELLEEAALGSGQTIHLGSVEMRFESDAPAVRPVVRVVAVPATEKVIPTPPPIVPSTVPPVSIGEAFCKFHPRTRARFLCPKCRHSYCDLCVNTRPEVGATRKFCRACGTECTPLQLRPVSVGLFKPSFPGQVWAAFAYPFEGDGLILLAAGTVFYSLIGGVTYLSRFALGYGLMAIGFLTIFGTGCLASYLRRILTSSAMGETAMPDWPEFSDFGTDILSPFFQLLGTVLACFAPAILIRIFCLRTALGPNGQSWARSWLAARIFQWPFWR